MKIRLKSSNEMLKIHSDSLPPYHGYTTAQFEWRNKILDKVGNMILEVETKYLFDDQFNTAPIPGISDSGIRAMNYMVAEIIEDVRPTAAHCDYCGRYELNVPDEKIGTRCPHCLAAEQGRGGYAMVSYVGKGIIQRFKIKPLSKDPLRAFPFLTIDAAIDNFARLRFCRPGQVGMLLTEYPGMDTDPMAPKADEIEWIKHNHSCGSALVGNLVYLLWVSGD